VNPLLLQRLSFYSRSSACRTASDGDAQTQPPDREFGEVEQGVGRGEGHPIVRTCCGRICLHRKKINLSTVFAGQAVGIKEVEEGIWLVSFMNYDLGYVDLEERTLQPLDNPFGPKVLPM
jgi:hypothetical protein